MQAQWKDPTPWSNGICHNLVPRDLNHLSLLNHISSLHWRQYTDWTKFKKKIAAILDFLIGHFHIRGWDTNLTKFRDLSEIFRMSVSRHVKILDVRWRMGCCIWPLLPTKKGTMPTGPLWILEATYSSFECYSSPFTKWPEKLLVWSGVQKKSLCHRSRLLCKLLCNLGVWSSRSDGAWGVSVRWRCCLEPLAGP